MTNTLAHRGPDAAGVWCDPASGVGLGHRRLSILDLSDEGAQPMHSPSGRYVAVYNGEVYNAGALRGALPGARWRGHSDTEALLAGIDRWGVAGAVTRAAGMFAAAVWDRAERALHLVRDRVGIKPLYYGFANGTLLFGSELKSLRRHPDFDATLDAAAVAQFLRYDYIPAPASVYRHVRKLPPGTVLTLRAPADAARGGSAPAPYWSALDVAASGQRAPFAGALPDAVDALDGLLRGVVREHLAADVPLGAFLSGGVDSSTVVAVMRAVAGGAPVRTFSIGFSEATFDEAPHARAVAEALGTVHTELYVSPDRALELVPRLPEVYDEPFADSSQLPTMLVSALTRQHVTVALSGDGGDELFGGYTRYGWTADAWRRVRRVPAPLRRAVARALRGASPAAADRVLSALRAVLPARIGGGLHGARMRGLADYLAPGSAAELYERVVTHLDPVWAMGAAAPPAASTHARRDAGGLLGPLLHEMMWWDQTTYLPDDILVKVDRASMAVGLEARVPLLDHRVVEFAWSLPPALLQGAGHSKLPLRGVLGRYLPPALVDRPKMGFSIPIAGWLRGPLREWMGDLLAPARLARLGLVEPAAVARLQSEHLAGSANRSWALWSVLMLTAWHDAQAGAAAPDDAFRQEVGAPVANDEEPAFGPATVP